MPEIVTIETPGLGDRSYLAHDGRDAVVIDPQRDIDRVTAVADSLGVRVRLVAETHLHNDYVTGGLALASDAGADYLVAADEEVAFARVPARDGESYAAGSLRVRVLRTPGHTPHHLSYVLEDGTGGAGAVFTGGSMLFGSVGRTDLVGAGRAADLARQQYRSVRRLASELGDEVEIHPTHGFGSFCAATKALGDASTLGEQRLANPALLATDEDRFVEELLAGYGPYPSYYAHMAALNAAGPTAPDLGVPAPLDTDALRRVIDAGGWVVDLRRRGAFASSHVAGTVSIELGDLFATYAGWVVPWGSELTLLADSPEQIGQARRQLARIGIDRLAGAAAGDPARLGPGRLSSYPLVDFEALAANWGRPDLVVLDVRRPDEYAAGHLAGAANIPVWQVPDRMAEIPAGEVWVHCAAGFRAAIAASLLDRAGRSVVHVDDEWAAAARAGLPVEP